MPNADVAQFLNKLESLERTRKRVESLLAQGEFAVRDVESLYEGLFLRAVVAFENLLERLFVDILRGKISTRSVGGKITAKSDGVLRAVLFEGKEYLDWLPYDRTVRRAERFLRGGRPFADLGPDGLDKLKQIVRIRNVIAHSSEHAKKQFRSKVIGSISLLHREKSPAGFLRSKFRTSPVMTRFELYVSCLGTIARKFDV